MLPSYVSGQSDGKQERLHGNKAQGLSSDAGFSGHCFVRKLAQGEAAWSSRKCMGFEARMTEVG